MRTPITFSRGSLQLVLLSLLLGFSHRFATEAQQAIPPRPEALKFEPLDYTPPDPADYRVELESGPVAYVVPDRELPLVNISIYIRAGQFLVPKGQEGLADITGYLIANGGTKKYSATELEERLDFLAAQLSSDFGQTHGTVSLNLLSKDLDEGLEILREVLTSPSFQEDRLQLRKTQVLQMMKQRNDDSAHIEARERLFLSYGNEFWMNQHATSNSIANISRKDAQQFHTNWVHPRNMVIAANGDFDKDAFVARLEKLLADWPYSSEKAPPVPTDTVFASPGVYVVNKDVNQGRVSIVLPGIQWDNPDYHAVTVMNDILGGGGFASRIVNRIRSDEGLAYSASSHFPGGTYFPSVFMAGLQSKSPTIAYAISLVLEEMKRIANESVTQDEIQTAKQYIIESFPRTFSSKARIANTFAQDELTGRYAKNPTFWLDYRKNIEAVTPEEVQRVAQTYLHPDKVVILVVGQKDDILKGHPNYPVTLNELTKSPIVELPLRDPMTMQPIEK